jgi:hypothetical protein
MAKLSARGRKEIARFSKEKFISNNELIDWERVTYAFMSDNHLLTKRDVHFLPSTHSAGYKHSYGWKDEGKIELTDVIKANLVKQDFVQE